MTAATVDFEQSADRAQAEEDRREIGRIFGVRYFPRGSREIARSTPEDMYAFTAYVGDHDVTVEQGDCAFWRDGGDARLQRGPASLHSRELAVVIRGYAPPDKSASLGGRMTLPYVNGCSTRQVFPPERPGDPTLQLLTIPPFSSEQAHHIHSTARVVLVLSGRGRSIVGMEGKSIAEDLSPGMVVILHNMCPHHFETGDEALVVMPVHVWSALPAGIETSHPMFNGTFLMNQGRAT